ncbi:MAG: hypothetical protein JNM30_13565 [Rhodospirillales bacterium]|nr:hypothetical protein [Rhodospirillales bacterium]
MEFRHFDTWNSLEVRGYGERMNQFGLALLVALLGFVLRESPGIAQDQPPSAAIGEPIGNRSSPTGSQSRQPEDGACNNPYGCGRGGSQANQRPSDVYCQQNPDGTENRGPYRGTGRNIPCKVQPDGSGAAKNTTAQQAASLKIVFNYFYINGINTPRDGVGRGTCLYDRGMIKGNLLDLGPRVGPSLQVKPKDAPSIKVADEIDKFEIETCNPSGTEGKALRAVQTFCEDTRDGKFAKSGPFTEDLAKLICIQAADIDKFRAQGLGGMSPGDVVEAFRQSLGLGFTDVKTGQPITGIEFTARQDEVAKVARAITGIYERELATARRPAQQASAGAPASVPAPAEKNFFIILAHSQGNFFAEGVAYRLMKGLGGKSDAAVFQSRLGILSVASPTNYKSLDPAFLGRAVKHFTRKDDGIHALDALAFLGSRVPWPAGYDLDALWPWKDEKTMRGSMELVRGQLDLKKAVYSPFFETLGLAPPIEPCPGCGALYTPLMNSHLLDNYLTDPVAASPNVAINLKAAPLFESGKPLSATAPPVLAFVRSDLVELKKALMTAR